jgi:hypothetical protein
MSKFYDDRNYHSKERHFIDDYFAEEEIAEGKLVVVDDPFLGNSLIVNNPYVIRTVRLGFHKQYMQVYYDKRVFSKDKDISVLFFRVNRAKEKNDKKKLRVYKDLKNNKYYGSTSSDRNDIFEFVTPKDDIQIFRIAVPSLTLLAKSSIQQNIPLNIDFLVDNEETKPMKEKAEKICREEIANAEQVCLGSDENICDKAKTKAEQTCQRAKQLDCVGLRQRAEGDDEDDDDYEDEPGNVKLEWLNNYELASVLEQNGIKSFKCKEAKMKGGKK